LLDKTTSAKWVDLSVSPQTDDDDTRTRNAEMPDQTSAPVATAQRWAVSVLHRGS
jgi:hypothetical protein